MNILLIGDKPGTSAVKSLLKEESLVQHCILWEDGPYVMNFSQEFLSGFDVIFISFPKEEKERQIYEILQYLLGKNSSTILFPFYQIAHANGPQMRVDQILGNPNCPDDLSGFVFGLSHAEAAIIPSLFHSHGHFRNFAISSQDIYYNLKTLEHIVANYPHKLSSLQYAIIDLYNYNYFNLDTSLTNFYGSYLSHGGFRYDEHNLAKNKHASVSFSDLISAIALQKYPALPSCQSLWETFFEKEQRNYFVHSLPPLFSFDQDDSTERLSIVTEQKLAEKNDNVSIVRNIFEDTISENIESFFCLLKLLYQINPNMKVYCILIPRYYKAQIRSREIFAPWKQMFYDTMQEFQSIFPITFLDLKKHPISNHPEYFEDVGHLNYPGAIEFSRYLNSLLN